MGSRQNRQPPGTWHTQRQLSVRVGQPALEATAPGSPLVCPRDCLGAAPASPSSSPELPAPASQIPSTSLDTARCSDGPALWAPGSSGLLIQKPHPESDRETSAWVTPKHGIKADRLTSPSGPPVRESPWVGKAGGPVLGATGQKLSRYSASLALGGEREVVSEP